MWIAERVQAESGFSLIELMAVIAIISILSNFALIYTGELLARVRDHRRMRDMESIYVALQAHVISYGCLPRPSQYGESNGGGWDWSSQGDFMPFLVAGGEFSRVPLDPVNNGSGPVGHPGGSGYAYGYICYDVRDGWLPSEDQTLTLYAVLESPDQYPSLPPGVSVSTSTGLLSYRWHEANWPCCPLP